MKLQIFFKRERRGRKGKGHPESRPHLDEQNRIDEAQLAIIYSPVAKTEELSQMQSIIVKAFAKRHITAILAMVRKDSFYLYLKHYNNQSNVQSLKRNILIKQALN